MIDSIAIVLFFSFNNIFIISNDSCILDLNARKKLSIVFFDGIFFGLLGRITAYLLKSKANHSIVHVLLIIMHKFLNTRLKDSMCMQRSQETIGSSER